jgi:NADPH:quinone reductase-like Zn-dependent oxidoreductase
MRAVTQDEFGGPEVLRLVDIDPPEPLPTEVLVRVHAAGINPVDWKSREQENFLGQPPFILGWDVAGAVADLGFGATGFTVGDEVLGMPWFPRAAGAYAEYVTAPSRQFVRKPAAMSFEEAAGLPLAGLTAWQALVDVADVQPGQRVLVQAAAGGVGHLAVQVAKARGAYVIATASPGKHDFVRSLGADEVLDYAAEGVASSVRDLDVLLGLVSSASDLAWMPALREGGLLIAVPGGVAGPIVGEAARLGVRISAMLVEPDQVGLRGLVELVENGQLRVHVDQVFPLADVAKAHELGARDRTTGKLILRIP